ncbi:MAG TPA: glycoside hydrolase family 15 protein [Steroidobacteraceae bacterium]|nr:glycoside hydrolase family 15 protein [Steroidobacteraceae bacterium]
MARASAERLKAREEAAVEMTEPLDAWIAREYRHAAAQMLRSISPLEVTKERPGFGQVVHPIRGAIVASPVPASYDPDPDYFFHWYRDSAAVIDALRVLAEESESEAFRRTAVGHFDDFVSFGLKLRELDGRALVAAPAWRRRVRADFVRFLRTDEDLAKAHGAAVAAETRVNADGTLDISSWPRPQHDGPALRALAVMRWLRSAARVPSEAAAAELLRADLDFTRARCGQPCFDIWEEELGYHYYTLCVGAAALEAGGAWHEAHGAAAEADACRAEAAVLRARLDGYWSAETGFFRSRVLASGERSEKELDISVVLAVIHADVPGIRHSVSDGRVHSTLARLDELFGAEYAINRNRPPGRAPALGRYRADVYYSGGAYYFSTLGAAELCFRAAASASPDSRAATLETMQSLIERGDAYLETVRAFTPPSGDLSEQFDQRSGEQSSAKHLAWSYAAFITCAAARRRALARAQQASGDHLSRGV